MRHEEDPWRQARCTQHGLHRQQLGVRHCRRDPRRYIPHSSTRFCIFRGAHLANCHYHTPYIQRNPGGRGPHQRLYSVKSPVAGVDAAAPALPCTRKKNTLATSSTCTACVASTPHRHACACHTCACTTEPVESRSIVPCWCKLRLTLVTSRGVHN